MMSIKHAVPRTKPSSRDSPVINHTTNAFFLPNLYYPPVVMGVTHVTTNNQSIWRLVSYVALSSKKLLILNKLVHWAPQNNGTA